MGAFLGPFCKDCRHHRPTEMFRGDMTPEQAELSAINYDRCVALGPGVVNGTMLDKLEQTIHMMRWSGPCGLRGYLFEPKPKEGSS